VVWQGSQAGNSDIYGRVFSPQGIAISDEFSINQITTANQFNPFVAGLTNGNAFVAWEGYQTGTPDIYGRIISSQGTAISNEFGINQNTTGNQGSTSVVSLTNGNVFVVWHGDQTGNSDIYGRAISPQGTAISDEFGINQNTSRTQQNPSVASLTNGDVCVAWEGNPIGSYYDIYGRAISPQGAAISDEFGINQNTTQDQRYPSVASLTNGNVLVTWYGDQTGDFDIYGRIISGVGLAPSPSPTPSTPTPSPAPTVAPTPSSANRLMPDWIMPIKFAAGGLKGLWNLAKTVSGNNLGSNSEEIEGASFHSSKPLQKVGNYVKSWFSSAAWGEYFDAMENSVRDYCTEVVRETPSYHSNKFLVKSTFHGNASLESSMFYNTTVGLSYLPPSIVSGAIGR